LPRLITEIVEEKSKLTDKCRIGLPSPLAPKEEIISNSHKLKTGNIKY